MAVKIAEYLLAVCMIYICHLFICVCTVKEEDRGKAGMVNHYNRCLYEHMKKELAFWSKYYVVVYLALICAYAFLVVSKVLSLYCLGCIPFLLYMDYCIWHYERKLLVLKIGKGIIYSCVSLVLSFFAVCWFSVLAPDIRGFEGYNAYRMFVFSNITYLRSRSFSTTNLYNFGPDIFYKSRYNRLDKYEITYSCDKEDMFKANTLKNRFGFNYSGTCNLIVSVLDKETGKRYTYELPVKVTADTETVDGKAKIGNIIDFTSHVADIPLDDGKHKAYISVLTPETVKAHDGYVEFLKEGNGGFDIDVFYKDAKVAKFAYKMDIEQGGKNIDRVPDGYVEDILKFTNIYRENNGIPPLEISPELNYVADIRAEEILRLFSHTRPDGTKFIEIFKARQIRAFSAGENIACGELAKETVDHWYQSPGHRKNLLNPKYKYLGVGCCYNNESPSKRIKDDLGETVTFNESGNMKYLTENDLNPVMGKIYWVQIFAG